MIANNVKELAAATILQAVKDYFDCASEPKKQAVILKDLRSSWMDLLTNGMSVVVAERLENHPAEIAERLNKMPKED